MTSYGARVEAIAAAMYDQANVDTIRWGVAPAWGDCEHSKPLSEGERDVWRDEAVLIVRRLNAAGVFVVSRDEVDTPKRRDQSLLTQRDVEMLDKCLEAPDTHQDTLAGFVPKLLDAAENMRASVAFLEDRGVELVKERNEAKWRLDHALKVIGILWRSRRVVQAERDINADLWRRLSDRWVKKTGFRRIDIRWEVGKPTFVDLDLDHGHRVVGYVHPEE